MTSSPETDEQVSGCVKCGGEDIFVRSCSECSAASNHKRHDEHLHYVCRNCAYDWTGDVLAASPETDEA